MASRNQRKVYGSDEDESPEKCWKCGCRHFDRARTTSPRGKTRVKVVCRNCGEAVSSETVG